MDSDEMTIREMCDAYGLTPRTLRFYEAKELIAPRRDGQTRWYSRRDRARLKLILRGKRFGFSLEDIRQLLELYEPATGNLEQMRRTYEIGRGRLAEMVAQRDELNEAIADLEEHMRWGESLIADASKRPA